MRIQSCLTQAPLSAEHFCRTVTEEHESAIRGTIDTILEELVLSINSCLTDGLCCFIPRNHAAACLRLSYFRDSLQNTGTNLDSTHRKLNFLRFLQSFNSFQAALGQPYTLRAVWGCCLVPSLPLHTSRSSLRCMFSHSLFTWEPPDHLHIFIRSTSHAIEISAASRETQTSCYLHQLSNRPHRSQCLKSRELVFVPSFSPLGHLLNPVCDCLIAAIS